MRVCVCVCVCVCVSVCVCVCVCVTPVPVLAGIHRVTQRAAHTLTDSVRHITTPRPQRTAGSTTHTHTHTHTLQYDTLRYETRHEQG